MPNDSPDTNDPEPETFGPYVVYERLGVGGMATVHRARERGIEGFERIVALKRLLPHLAEDASFVKSFVREAKFASMLQHANIVQLYELGRVGAVYYISMELIEGRDLRRILHQARRAAGPPNLNVAVSLLTQLCDALDYAHTRTDEQGEPLGLVHRDVSPSNLLVTRSGHLKVIDFGIAKAQTQQLQTRDGKIKGKLAYMAPEAITGGVVDARSDLFSVGVIAHELLTARALFASKSEYQTLINVQRAEIAPPSAFNEAVPPELDAIVARALARDPAQRYASAAEMRDELHDVRTRYGLSATNREVEAWCAWAFSLDRAGTFSGVGGTDSLGGASRSRSRTPSPVVPTAERVAMAARPPRATPDDDEAAAIAWGGGDDAAAVVHELPDLAGSDRSVRVRRTTVERTPVPEGPGFGAGIVEPRHSNFVARGLAVVAAVAVLGGIGFVLLSRSGGASAASSAARTTAAAEPSASLKFIVEPADATIKLAGMDAHVGGPWTVELEPGVVQVKVSRDGHQSWETAVELSRGESQTIRVALAEAAGDPNVATLTLGSQPGGLAIVLDGQDLGEKTPWTSQLPAGTHTVQLRDASGAIAWKQTFIAEPRTRYEFNPSMTAAKQAERVARERTAPAPARREAERAAASSPPPAPPVAEAEVEVEVANAAAATAKPAPPPPPVVAPRPTPPSTPPAALTTPAPAAMPAPTRVAAATPAPAHGPVVVPPTAVKRRSGSNLTLSAIVRPGTEIPKRLAAKICIDERGGVTSVDVFKATGEVARAFAEMVRGWRYTPYVERGVATPACFVNSFGLGA